MLTPITRDLFNIASRLRTVNPSYCLFWNNQYNRYEVHSRPRPSFTSFCFTVNANELDARVLEYALKTRVANFDDLEVEFASHNSQLETAAANSLKASISLLDDMMNYAASREHEVVFGPRAKWL